MPSEEEVVEAAGALAGDEADRLVFLSDLWLDKPATLDRLRVVLAGEKNPEPLIILHLPPCHIPKFSSICKWTRQIRTCADAGFARMHSIVWFHEACCSRCMKFFQDLSGRMCFWL